MKPLTRKQTEGTLTFFFPHRRDEETPPRATLMVRRVGEEEWHAGLAICSDADMFSKRIGRRIAFHRLQGCPLRDDNVLGLLRRVASHLDRVTVRHRYYDLAGTAGAMSGLEQRLEHMRVE